MKSKFAVPIISAVLIIVTVISAFLSVSITKNKKVMLSDSDVNFSNIIVDGKSVKITVSTSNSLGMKITGNSYTFENGVLNFKLYGSKNLTIGKPMMENHIVDLVIDAPNNITKINFVYLDSKGEEKTAEKTFKRGELR